MSLSKAQNRILHNQSGFYRIDPQIQRMNQVIFAASSYHEIRRTDGIVVTVFHERRSKNSHRIISSNHSNFEEKD